MLVLWASHGGGVSTNERLITSRVDLVFICYLIMWVVMKTVDPGEVAFRKQLRLGLQPMLRMVPVQRTLAQIIEVCPSGDLVR